MFADFTRASSREAGLWADSKEGHRRLNSLIEARRRLEDACERCERLGVSLRPDGNGSNRYSRARELALAWLESSDPYKRRLAQRVLEAYERFSRYATEIKCSFAPWVRKYAEEVARRLGGKPQDYYPHIEAALEQALSHLNEPNYMYIRQWLAQKARRLVEGARVHRRVPADWFCPKASFLAKKMTLEEAREEFGCESCERTKSNCAPQRVEGENSFRKVSLEDLRTFEGERTSDDEVLARRLYHLGGIAAEEEDPVSFQVLDRITVLSRAMRLPLNEKALSCLWCGFQNGVCEKGRAKLREAKNRLRIIIAFSRAQTWAKGGYYGDQGIPGEGFVSCPERHRVSQACRSAGFRMS